MIKHLQEINDNNKKAVKFFIDVTDRNLRINERLVKNIHFVVSEDCVSPLQVKWQAKRSNKAHNKATISAFFWGSKFTQQLKAILIEAGFSEDATDNVWGQSGELQKAGCASFSSNELGDEIRKQCNMKIDTVPRKQEAISRLEKIIDDAGELAHEARELIETHFPELATQHAAFNFTGSRNPDDITVESLYEAAKSYNVYS